MDPGEQGVGALRRSVEVAQPDVAKGVLEELLDAQVALVVE
jgi:hypothetical protein